jgi:hypothetical protein
MEEVQKVKKIPARALPGRQEFNVLFLREARAKRSPVSGRLVPISVLLLFCLFGMGLKVF